MNLSKSNSLALADLKKEWMRAGLFFVLFIGGVYLFFHRNWNAGYALRWLSLSSAFGLWQLWVLWRSLSLNHREGEDALLPTLGWGSTVSFGRGIFIAALLGFLFSPWTTGWLAWLPFTFYLLAALSDILDGYLARVNNHVTKLGAALDMSNDSWGVLIVTLLVFWYGQVPIWYLPVGLARYIFLAGLWWREKQGKENTELPHSFRRRIFAGVQMGFIVSMLAPVFSPPATTIAATLFMLPFLVGFLYDWFLVTGKIDPDKGAAFFARIASLKMLRIIPLALRLVVVWFLWSYTHMVGDLIFREYSQFLGLLWYMISFAALPMLLFGVVGRLGAIFVLISSGMAFSIPENSFIYMLLIGAGTILFFTGTGAFSLWSPEEWLIYNRAGEQRNA